MTNNMHDKTMEIPIYNDYRDHIYQRLIDILLSLGDELLCAKNEHDLWQLIHDVVMFSRIEYEFFIDVLQKMKEAHDSADVIYRRFLCDEESLTYLVYQEQAEALEELRNRKMSISPPFKKQYLNLIVDLVCGVTEKSYRRFLELIESLRDAQVQHVLECFTPHLP